MVTVHGPEPADLARRLTEGRKRQVRRMFEAVGLRVTRVRRVRLGPVTLGDLAAGAARELEAGEVETLRRDAAQASVSRSSHVSG